MEVPCEETIISVQLCERFSMLCFCMLTFTVKKEVVSMNSSLYQDSSLILYTCLTVKVSVQKHKTCFAYWCWSLVLVLDFWGLSVFYFSSHFMCLCRHYYYLFINFSVVHCLIYKIVSRDKILNFCLVKIFHLIFTFEFYCSLISVNKNTNTSNTINTVFYNFFQLAAMATFLVI